MIKAYVVGSRSSFTVSTNLNGSKEHFFQTVDSAIDFAESLIASQAVRTYEVYVDGYSINGSKEEA